jgi:hypothetical protein
MVVRPGPVSRFQKRLDGILVAGRVTLKFATCAQALVRLDVRAGGHLLQEHFDRFGALGAFEGKDAGRFKHGQELLLYGRLKPHFIIGPVN